jgi:hypothetical protein
MTDYQFHWWPPGSERARTERVSRQAESHLHGAALALRDFVRLGCNIATPLAHLDIIEPGGATQTVLVEEVLDWLNRPAHADFVEREGLKALLPVPESGVM